MPCLIALLALISPRLALVFVAIFSDMLSRAYDSWLLPLIGFFLLPWTTLAYAVMWDPGTRDVNGFEWFIVILAFVADIASYAGGRSYQLCTRLSATPASAATSASSAPCSGGRSSARRASSCSSWWSARAG